MNKLYIQIKLYIQNKLFKLFIHNILFIYVLHRIIIDLEVKIVKIKTISIYF